MQASSNRLFYILKKPCCVKMKTGKLVLLQKHYLQLKKQLSKFGCNFFKKFSCDRLRHIATLVTEKSNFTSKSELRS